MRLAVEEFSFCCLGVKANVEDMYTPLTDEQREDLELVGEFDGQEFSCMPSDEYLPEVCEEAQAFFASLNDEANLGFDQIAFILQTFRSDRTGVIAALDWVEDMQGKEYGDWRHAMQSGAYKQTNSTLAQANCDGIDDSEE